MSRSNGHKLERIVLADAPMGAIVRHQGRWGVVTRAPDGQRHAWHTRIVDFWDGGREFVRDTDVVHLAPNKHSR